MTNHNLDQLPKINMAVIGGSGLYTMEALQNTQEIRIETPFGTPSDDILVGDVIDEETGKTIPVAFLSRHARGHKFIPSEVPYQANIYALKMLGVNYIMSVSAVGSLQEKMQPLHMVLPKQMIDMTKHRQSTFFGKGAVAHVSMAEPICNAFSQVIYDAFNQSDINSVCHNEGTYVCIEGPQFSSLAESHWYRSMNADVIGMTNMPEAKLAKEASIAYATLALVTDYDCWHPHEEQVSADYAIKNLMQNAENAQKVILETIKLLAKNPVKSNAHTALSQALVTPIEAMDDATKKRLLHLLPKKSD